MKMRIRLFRITLFQYKSLTDFMALLRRVFIF